MEAESVPPLVSVVGSSLSLSISERQLGAGTVETQGTSFEICQYPLSPEIRTIAIPLEESTFEITKSPSDSPDSDLLVIVVEKFAPVQQSESAHDRPPNEVMSVMLSSFKNIHVIITDNDTTSTPDLLQIRAVSSYSRPRGKNYEPGEAIPCPCRCRFRFLVPFARIDRVVRRRELNFKVVGDRFDALLRDEGWKLLVTEPDVVDHDKHSIGEIPKRLAPFEIAYERIPFRDEQSIHRLFPEVENGVTGVLAYLLSFLGMSDLVSSVLLVSRVVSKAAFSAMSYHKVFSPFEYDSMFSTSSSGSVGISELLMLRIVRHNMSFEFDRVYAYDGYVVDRNCERIKQINLLAYYFLRGWTNEELLDLLLSKCDPRPLGSLFLEMYFHVYLRSETHVGLRFESRPLEWATAKKLLRLADLTSGGKLSALDAFTWLLAETSFSDGRDEGVDLKVLKCFLNNDGVRSIFSRCQRDKGEDEEEVRERVPIQFFVNLLQADFMVGIRSVMDVFGDVLSERFGSMRPMMKQWVFEYAESSPAAMAYLVEELLLVLPNQRVMERIIGSVWCGEEEEEEGEDEAVANPRLGREEATLTYLLKQAEDEESTIDPNLYLSSLYDMSEQMRKVFLSHPRVSKEGIIRGAALHEKSAEKLREVLRIVDDVDGEKKMLVEVSSALATEILNRVASVGNAVTMRMLLGLSSEENVFIPTEETLAFAIHPDRASWIDRSFRRNDEVIELLMKQASCWSFDQMKLLVVNINIRMVKKALELYGVNQFSDPDMLDLFVRLCRSRGESPAEALAMIADARLEDLLRSAPDSWKHDVLVELCGSKHHEYCEKVTAKLLSDPVFYAGLESYDPRVLSAMGRMPHEILVMYMERVADGFTAAEISDSGVLGECARFGAADSMQFLLSDSLVDPSVDENRALRHSLWTSAEIAALLLEDSRVRRQIDSVACGLLGVSRHPDGLRLLLEVDEFNPAVFKPPDELGRGEQNPYLLFEAVTRSRAHSLENFKLLYRSPQVEEILNEDILVRLLVLSISPKERIVRSDEPMPINSEVFRFLIQDISDSEGKFDVTKIPLSVGTDVFTSIAKCGSLEDLQLVLDCECFSGWRVPDEAIVAAKEMTASEMVATLVRVQGRQHQDDKTLGSKEQ